MMFEVLSKNSKAIMFSVCMGSFLFAAVMLCSAFYNRNSPANVRFASNAVVLRPLNPGEQREAEFEILNNSDGPVTICGFQASCSCATPQKLPLTLLSGEHVSVSVAVKNKSQDSKQSDIRFSFITDSSDVPFLQGIVRFQ